VENWLWKRLWACGKKDYGLIERKKERKTERLKERKKERRKKERMNERIPQSIRIGCGLDSYGSLRDRRMDP